MRLTARRLPSMLVRVVPPLVPPLVLLLLIATHAVNVPRWDDWGLVPLVVALREGHLGWAELWRQHNEHRLAAVKLLAAPLIWATDFDVRALMYEGFALQVLAFVFLSRMLAATLPQERRLLRTGLALAIALLMFSPAQHETWLWALTSIQWHLCNLAPAAAVWLYSRRPPPWLTLGVCFLLTCAAMLAVASGIALWGVALVVIATEAAVARKPPSWAMLAAWSAGALLLAAYFTGFRTTAGASDLSYFLTHPRQFVAFVRIYLGWPMVQGTDLRLAAAAGTAGLLGLVAAFYAALARRFLTDRLLPWLWLSSYALLVAIVTAVGRVQTGLVTATTIRYSTGALFFWIGLLVVAAIALQRWLERAPAPRRRVAAVVTATVVLALGLTYARLYREGYWRFVQTRQDRLIALAELWDYERAPDEALTLLYPPSAQHVRKLARVLESHATGPFAPRMSVLRSRLARLTSTASHVVDGQGYVEVAECIYIGGWAWDRSQPDLAVNVDVYGDGVRLGTVPAYWFRRDLLENGIGNGHHSYVFTPPPSLKDGRVHLIRARISGTDVDLLRSPRTFVCSDTQSVRWR